MMSILFLISTAHAGVEVESSLNNGNGGGKRKDLRETGTTLVISQYNLWFMTTRQPAYESAGNKVSMRVELDLDVETAQAITDAAWAQFQGQLAEAGYDVVVRDPAAIEATRTYGKCKKKDDAASIGNGGAWHQENPDRVDNRIGAWANGVTSVYLGEKCGMQYPVVAIELAADQDNLELSYVGVIDFLDAKGSVGGGFVELGATPRLAMVDELTYGQSLFAYVTPKGGPYLGYGGHELVWDDTSWVTSFERPSGDVPHITLDVEAYTAGVLELTRVYNEQLIARMQAAQTK